MLREVYRTRQSQLIDLFNSGKFGFHGLIMAKKNDLSYGDIVNDLEPMMNQVRTILEAYLQNQSGQSEKSI